jgi:hypothetical protein
MFARLSTVLLALLLPICRTSVSLAADVAPDVSSNKSTFSLIANPTFSDCLSGSNPHTPPSATVTVTKGNLNDTLTIKVRHVKPHLAFDLFTVQNTPLNSDGSANGTFPGNFGLAWYQSDLQANAAGNATVTIKTILVNQIFGFDAGTGLTPTNTFNVGFWFNDPNDATACTFTGSTPFNGEHNAGPMAMISGADLTTGLGPLCLNPNTSTVPASCNP